jgi:hypothetical protein
VLQTELIVAVVVGQPPVQIAGVLVGRGALDLLVQVELLVLLEVVQEVDFERVGLVEAEVVELCDGLLRCDLVLVLNEHVS